MTLCLPSPDLQILIRESFNEHLETRFEYLNHIKDWLRKQPHLPDEWGEVQILSFLRSCNYSLEITKRKLDKYFTVRAALPEFFENWDIKRPELVAITKIGYACALPVLTPEGRRVIVLRGHTKNMETPNVTHFIRVALMFADVRMKEELYGVAGDIYIFDASILTTGHFSRAANPVLLKKFLVCIGALPVKVKEIHVVNATSLVDIVVNWIMLFAKKKHRDLVHIHTSTETLYDFVPKNVLPEEYGGSGGNLKDLTKEWIKKIDDNTDFFKRQEKLKADESRRPGIPTKYDDLFGLNGSFKKLTID